MILADTFQMRKCTKCEQTKPETQFSKTRLKCKECVNSSKAARRALAEMEATLLDQKTCKVCKKEKHIGEFYFGDSSCKVCRKAKVRVYQIRPDNDFYQYRKMLVEAAKYRALEAGFQHSIYPEDIRLPTHCPVLGIPLVIGGTHATKDQSPTIDRIDNSKGYTPDNIRVISYRANRIKNDATPEEMRRVLAYMEGRLIF